MLVELGLVEQRYKAVCEVLEGATVTDVPAATAWCARPCTIGCRYASGGLADLTDASSKPLSCPHQTVASGPCEASDDQYPWSWSWSR